MLGSEAPIQPLLYEAIYSLGNTTKLLPQNYGELYFTLKISEHPILIQSKNLIFDLMLHQLVIKVQE